MSLRIDNTLTRGDRNGNWRHKNSSNHQPVERLAIIVRELDQIASELFGESHHNIPRTEWKIDHDIFCFAELLQRVSQLRRDVLPKIAQDEFVWEMLLDLFIAEEAKISISVSSLCNVGGKSPTAGLRSVNKLISEGLAYRRPDAKDKRRIIVALTDRGRDAIRYVHRRVMSSPSRRVPKRIYSVDDTKDPDPIEEDGSSNRTP